MGFSWPDVVLVVSCAVIIIGLGIYEKETRARSQHYLLFFSPEPDDAVGEYVEEVAERLGDMANQGISPRGYVTFLTGELEKAGRLKYYPPAGGHEVAID